MQCVAFSVILVFIMEPDIQPQETFEYIQPRKPIKKTRGSFYVRMFFVLLLFICLCVAGIIAILHSSRFQFNEIRVFGVNTFPVSEIKQYTHDYMTGYYLKVIPKSSTVLFSKDKFERNLKQQFPIIQIAYTTFPKPDSIDIHIQEKIPVAVWCFTDHVCEFIDQHGIVYAHAPQFSEGVYPIFQSVKESTSENTIGKQIIDPVIMNRFATLFNKLQSNDIKISNVMFYEDGDIGFAIEKLFDRYPSNNARLLGTFNQDDEVFLRDIVTGLTHQAFKSQYTLNPKDLDYIDMRFAGKIFYKFKSKNTPLETASIVQ